MNQQAIQRRGDGPGIVEMLRTPNYVGELGRVLAATGTDPQRFANVAIVAVKKNWVDEKRRPKLSKCTPNSIFLALLECAQLDLNPLSGEFWFVPFADKCVGMLGVEGMLRIPRRAGAVAHIGAKIRWAGDEFEFEQVNGQPKWRHVPYWQLGRARGDLLFTYCHWRLPSGLDDFVVADKARIERARTAAKTQMVWNSDFHKMARKTAVREAWGSGQIPRDRIPMEYVAALDDDLKREVDGFTSARVDEPAWMSAVAPPQTVGELEPAFDVDAPLDVDEDPTAKHAP